MKAAERFFPEVLFITLCKVALTFKPVFETLECENSNESN